MTRRIISDRPKISSSLGVIHRFWIVGVSEYESRRPINILRNGKIAFKSAIRVCDVCGCRLHLRAVVVGEYASSRIIKGFVRAGLLGVGPP